MEKEYDLIFSLGGSCAAACQLVQRGLRFCSLPLDYTFFRYDGKPLRKLAESFDNDFKYFLLKENLRELKGDERGAEHDGKMQYIDTYTGYRWINHFEQPIENEGSYEKVKEKIDRRINRLKDLLAKSTKVLAICTNASTLEKDCFDVLTQVLTKKYPQLQIEYIYIHYECEKYITKTDGNLTTIEVPNAENFYDFARTNYYWRFLDDLKLSGCCIEKREVQQAENTPPCIYTATAIVRFKFCILCFIFAFCSLPLPLFKSRRNWAFTKILNYKETYKNYFFNC